MLGKCTWYWFKFQELERLSEPSVGRECWAGESDDSFYFFHAPGLPTWSISGSKFCHYWATGKYKATWNSRTSLYISPYLLVLLVVSERAKPQFGKEAVFREIKLTFNLFEPNTRQTNVYPDRSKWQKLVQIGITVQSTAI